MKQWAMLDMCEMRENRWARLRTKQNFNKLPKTKKNFSSHIGRKSLSDDTVYYGELEGSEHFKKDLYNLQLCKIG